ncbi:hypothetical protein BJ508DRAFT_314880 [Ascobolus immersus RN42]|uniref:Uncharacterized protein n=1 Tax=Ascobolus immersus RN42 TaxID=1160509 RepID=A0A3N4HJ95_ASCIM|nr:hypothetical protein BJ508DRAFT_314880 [Ascobolus immersus RN42]
MPVLRGKGKKPDKSAMTVSFADLDPISQLESMMAELDPHCPKDEAYRIELLQALREVRRLKAMANDNGYLSDNPFPRGIKALENAELNVNQQRILELQNYFPIGDPVVTEDDLINVDAVIAAYESGELDITKKKDPEEVALFWNGRLIKNWHIMGLEYTEEWPELQKKWGGKACVEKGLLKDLHYSYASSYEITANARGQHMVTIHALHHTNPEREIPLAALDDSGSSNFHVFESDLPVLGILPGSSAYRDLPVRMGTANGEVTRRVVRVNMMWRDPHTGEPASFIFVENCVVMPGVYDPDGDVPRLSGRSMRKKLYVASAPVEPVTLYIGETRNGAVKNLPRVVWG